MPDEERVPVPRVANVPAEDRATLETVASTASLQQEEDVFNDANPEIRRVVSFDRIARQPSFHFDDGLSHKDIVWEKVSHLRSCAFNTIHPQSPLSEWP